MYQNGSRPYPRVHCSRPRPHHSPTHTYAPPSDFRFLLLSLHHVSPFLSLPIFHFSHCLSSVPLIHLLFSLTLSLSLLHSSLPFLFQFSQPILPLFPPPQHPLRACLLLATSSYLPIPAFLPYMFPSFLFSSTHPAFFSLLRFPVSIFSHIIP